MKVIKIRNKDGERVCDAAMDPGSGDIVLITKDGKHFKNFTVDQRRGGNYRSRRGEKRTFQKSSSQS